MVFLFFPLGLVFKVSLLLDWLPKKTRDPNIIPENWCESVRNRLARFHSPRWYPLHYPKTNEQLSQILWNAQQALYDDKLQLCKKKWTSSDITLLNSFFLTKNLLNFSGYLMLSMISRLLKHCYLIIFLSGSSVKWIKTEFWNILKTFQNRIK